MSDRENLIPIVRGLMVAENLGDVHDQLMALCRELSLPEPTGDYFDGFGEDLDKPEFQAAP